MRLLSTSDPEDIGRIISRYHKETRALEKQIHEICWFMRGGVTRDEAWVLSHYERKSILKLIDDNIERVNKTKLPIL